MYQQHKTSTGIVNVSFLCNLLNFDVLSIMPLTLAKGKNSEEMYCGSLGAKNYTGFCPPAENLAPSVRMDTLLSPVDVSYIYTGESGRD